MLSILSDTGFHLLHYCAFVEFSSPPYSSLVPFTVYNTTEDGWLIYNDSQYFIINDKLSMEAARASCKKNFSELAVINGEDERKFLWKQVRCLYGILTAAECSQVVFSVI